MIKDLITESDSEWIKDMTHAFRWVTMKREILTVDQMKTSHIFNSMKMMFNHLAQHYNGEPIWYGKQYNGYHEAAKENPKEIARQVVFFIWHIEQRGDLPIKYKTPYTQIINQLLGIKGIENKEDVPQLDLVDFKGIDI